MSDFYMKPKPLPMDDSWDVIVVGGGPSGCAAATASAREGARTLLIEATGCLGGMGTSGLVPAWCPFSDKEKIIYRSIAQQVFEASKKATAHVQPNALDWVPINAEALKVIYDDLVIGSGAKVIFNTQLSAVESNKDGNVTAIIVSNKKGLNAYRAKVYIDCTGDADLAVWAGAEYVKGDEKTGEMQPATHCFVLGNVDEYAYKYGPRMHGSHDESPIHDILKAGGYSLIKDSHICNNTVAPREVGFNAGHIWYVDNTKPENITNALIEGRKMAEQYREALAKFHPKAFANSFVSETASLMGIRETRRIIGDYVLTVEDYVERKSFDDDICRNSYYIDVHYSIDEASLISQNKKDEVKRPQRYKDGESHGVPYRCLVPKNLKNVIVAGRSISCERLVQGSVRVMPVCLATGEAAGIASVIALKNSNSDIHKVDVKVLQGKLREYGAYLPIKTDGGAI